MFLVKVFNLLQTIYYKFKNYFGGCSYSSLCRHWPTGKFSNIRHGQSALILTLDIRVKIEIFVSKYNTILPRGFIKQI